MATKEQGDANAGSRAAIDLLVWLIEGAFERDNNHALLVNLASVSDEEWTALPPGGERSIANIVEHVAWCKWMYEDYANLRTTPNWSGSGSPTGASGCPPAPSWAS